MTLPAAMQPLANHLWQSTLFAGAACLIALALRKHGAHVRHWVWLAASLKFLVPFSVLLWLGTLVAIPPTAPAPPAAIPAVLQAVSVPFDATPPAPALVASTTPAGVGGFDWVAFAWVAWFCGLCVVLLAWWRNIRQIAAVLRRAEPVGMPHRVRAMVSTTIFEPGVFGIWKPVLLLPVGIEQRLEPPQFEAVLAHEAAHVARRDNLTSALQMLIEAIFWFYPLVWWMGTRLAEERERACDEAVLLAGYQPRDYAAGILKVCELYMSSPLACVSGVAGGKLKSRIELILRNTPTRRLTRSGAVLLLAAGITALAAPILGGMQLVVPQFDAVSIKLSRDAGAFIKLPAVSGSVWRADNATADTFIAYAFDSARGAATAFDPRIINAPKWLATTRYYVAAKIPSGTPVEQVPLMVQAMLFDRFQLKMHREARQLMAFSLSVAPGGAKLAANKDCGQPDEPHLSKDGLLCGTIANQRDATGPNVIIARGVTAQQIADWAFGNENSKKDMPVADRTGLSGLYDFKLVWTPEANRRQDGRVSSEQASQDNMALLVTAVKEQLGLLLNLAHASRQPVQAWVIDGIAMPTPN